MEKDFHRVTRFTHGEALWSTWAWSFKNAMGTASMELKDIMDKLEGLDRDEGIDELIIRDPPFADRIGLRKLNYEMYEVLAMLTDGEAQLIVKAVQQNDGLLAWQKLFRHYNRRTLARTLREHREVMYPKQQKGMAGLISAIMEWEEKWRTMAKNLKVGAIIPELWKVAAFLELCPPDVQDFIYQTIDIYGGSYEITKQKVVSWTSNKVASSSGGAVPMDVGGIKTEKWEYEEEYEEVDVDAVGNPMQCFNCQGWGHAARNCPSAKGSNGQGKGDYGKGDCNKGGAKAKGKGDYGKGDYGKGRVRQGRQSTWQGLSRHLLQVRKGRTQGVGVPWWMTGRGQRRRRRARRRSRGSPRGWRRDGMDNRWHRHRG